MQYPREAARQQELSMLKRYEVYEWVDEFEVPAAGGAKVIETK